MASATPLADELRALEQGARDAHQKFIEAKDKRRHERGQSEAEVVRPLADLRDAVRYRKPGAPSGEELEAKQREVTEQVVRDLLDQGMVLEALDQTGGVIALAVRDRRRLDAVDRAEAEARAAGQAVQQFKDDNADALREESERAQAEAVKAALDSGDTDAIRDALGVGGDGAAAMTAPEPRREKAKQGRVGRITG